MILALVLTAAMAFIIVGAAAVVAARGIAEENALAESTRSAQTLANVIFAPSLPAVLSGDPAASARLDDAVRARRRDGGLVRVKVWNRDGIVLYSDAPSAIGQRFPLNTDVTAAIDKQTSAAELSNLTDAENITEHLTESQQVGDQLVEVYVPVTVGSDQHLALEVYTTTARVDTARSQLVGKLVPFALLSLLLLIVAQLPISVGLLRRATRADAERSRLLLSALTASERERRSIARDLHDGVVQDLAGAGYAIGAVKAGLPKNSPPELARTIDTVSAVVRRAVASLRTLMVDIYPPELTATGLPAALRELTARLSSQHIATTVTVAIDGDLSPEVTAAAYRSVRECLSNIVKHADASHAWIDASTKGNHLRLRIADDGNGPPSDGQPVERGHLGLQLLRDGLRDLGGELTLRPRDGGGTEVLIRIPDQP